MDHVELWKMRKAAGLTQRELGSEIGMTHTAIGNVEKGRHSTNLETVERWARACGFELCYQPAESGADAERQELTLMFMEAVTSMGPRARAVWRAQLDAELSFKE